MRQHNRSGPTPPSAGAAACPARLPLTLLAAGLLGGALWLAAPSTAMAITCDQLGSANAQINQPTTGDCTISGAIKLENDLEVAQDLFVTGGPVTLDPNLTITVGRDYTLQSGVTIGSPGTPVTFDVGRHATINGTANTAGTSGPGGGQTYEIGGDFSVGANASIRTNGGGGGATPAQAGGDVTATIGGNATITAGATTVIQTGGAAVDFTVEGDFTLNAGRTINTAGSPAGTGQNGLNGGPFTFAARGSAQFAGVVTAVGSAGGSGTTAGGNGGPLSVLACGTLNTVSGADLRSSGGNGSGGGPGGNAANQTWHSDGNMTLVATTNFRATGGSGTPLGASGQFFVSSAGTVTNSATFSPSAGLNLQSGVATQCAEPGITKELTDGEGNVLEEVEVEKGRTSSNAPTEFDVEFTIRYTQDPETPNVIILDTVPAQWWVVKVNEDFLPGLNGNLQPVSDSTCPFEPDDTNGDGTISIRPANGCGWTRTRGSVGATQIQWIPDPEVTGEQTLVVQLVGRLLSSGRYQPNACGEFRINDGAIAFERNPDTGSIVTDDFGPVMVFDPTDPLFITAVGGDCPPPPIE